MNKNFILSALLISASVVIFSSCKKTTVDPPTGAGAFTSGVFVSCEGPFGTGTGTVSFFNRSTKTSTGNIFETANSFPLGNVVQSISIWNNKAYMVVNNSGKCQVAKADDFKSAGTISGLAMPRYFLGVSSTKGYISEWQSGTGGDVAIVDLSINAVTGFVTTGLGADRMFNAGGKIYVLNSGGFGVDSTVSVISTSTDAVTKTFVAGDIPNTLAEDANGDIWILCSGQPSWSGSPTSGRLVRIDPAFDSVVESFSFNDTTSNPSNLVVSDDGQWLFYQFKGHVFKMNIADGSLPSIPIIMRGFYSLGYDPATHYLYGGDARDFASNGEVIRYDQSGVLVDSFAVGVIPGNFFFR